MSQDSPKFELPGKIENLIAFLFKLYSRKGQTVKQKILVNSKIEVREGVDYDNWNGGIHGHALYLHIPESLFLDIMEEKDHIQKRIKDDLDKLHSINDEYFMVYLEKSTETDENWRKSSGLQIQQKKHVAPDAEERIWEKGLFRVFLTHKAEDKENVAQLKKELAIYGISGFVAHEDIEPTKEWQDEIENALFSMDAMVALMSKCFHDSNWTDQEIGCALGRRIPVIPIRMGRDPYGFIGKYQAVSASWEDVCKEIVKILIEDDKMKDAYIRAVAECSLFENANELSAILPIITQLSDAQVENLVQANNDNYQVRESHGFNGSRPNKFGPGLVAHLKRITGKKFSYSQDKSRIIASGKKSSQVL